MKDKFSIVGKIVKPHNIGLSQELQKLFGNGKVGLIIRADWEDEERKLYIEILTGETIIERQYNSFSIFQMFWEEVRPKTII